MKRNSQLAQLLQNTPGLMPAIKIGDLISGTVIQKAAKSVYFDLGSFGTGIVYGAEFSAANDIIKTLKTSDRASVKIVDLDNDQGFIELSLAAAGQQKAWQDIKELKDGAASIKVKIEAANSGGLIAQVNDLQAFIPVSQLSTDHYPRVDDGDRSKILEELKKLVGEELEVKVIDVNPRAKKLILSEKEVASDNIKELVNKYKTGDIVDGIISGVADFGAFMRFADNPDIEGLIHISELEHKLIENPKEVVKVDDAVKAKIIEIKDGRVWLSLKALKSDPWETVEEKYKTGEEIIGKINRFNPFGAFVSLDPDIQGLIHVSEFGSVEEMKNQIAEGNFYKFTIEAVKPQEKRIILKLKSDK
ncbi:MAG: S1 RNA-binding domain-containing protein [bacterium]|nr:S1 RNA-binding domain-containing protein [bacterium]